MKQLSLHKLSAKIIPMNPNLSTKEILNDFKHFHMDLHTVGIFLDYNCDGSRELLETVSLSTCNSLGKLEKQCIWFVLRLVWEMLFNQIQMVNLWAWNSGKWWFSCDRATKNFASIYWCWDNASAAKSYSKWKWQVNGALLIKRTINYTKRLHC